MILIKSHILKNGGILPEKYTCDGQDINPPFLIESVHPQAESLVLIMEDLDAMFGFSNHWIVWNIPPETREIREDGFSNDAVVGVNSFNENKYCGPCPRFGGEHHYMFTFYALNARLDLPASSKMQKLEESLTNHLLDEGKFLVTYKPKNSLNNFLDLA